MQTFDIFTIGAATRDIFVRSPKFEETPNPNAPDGTSACFPMGGKIDVSDMTFSTGGGATNAAVTFARFGLNTVCVARVGCDDSAAYIHDQLSAEGINVHHLQMDEEHATAHSIILLSGTGHRSILTYRSASEHLSAQDIPWKALSARWIYLTNVSANMDVLEQTFAAAKSMGATVAWNPGAAELRLGKEALEPFLKHVAVLILNREEACLLSEQPKRDLKAMIAHLEHYPSRALVITDGQQGAYVHSGGQTWYAPALKTTRVNATGAGDAFGSAFVAGLALGLPVEDCLRTAMLNATSVVSHMGAKAGILKKPPTKAALQKVEIRQLVL
ncbi:MAG: carbohydrate kinase family protein [Patescibacteria group bacterium]